MASEPKSYSPICLLPKLGKLLEKLLVNRLFYFLENTYLLHNFQFGFREGRTCELTLEGRMSSIASNIENGKYTTVTSMDIQGAFETIE